MATRPVSIDVATASACACRTSGGCRRCRTSRRVSIGAAVVARDRAGESPAVVDPAGTTADVARHRRRSGRPGVAPRRRWPRPERAIAAQVRRWPRWRRLALAGHRHHAAPPVPAAWSIDAVAVAIGGRALAWALDNDLGQCAGARRSRRRSSSICCSRCRTVTSAAPVAPPIGARRVRRRPRAGAAVLVLPTATTVSWWPVVRPVGRDAARRAGRPSQLPRQRGGRPAAAAVGRLGDRVAAEIALVCTALPLVTDWPHHSRRDRAGRHRAGAAGDRCRARCSGCWRGSTGC